MNKIIRQTIRGCGTLPHVGSHPGKLFILFLIIGFLGGLWPGLVFTCFFGTVYLLGAYNRAQASDFFAGKSDE